MGENAAPLHTCWVVFLRRVCLLYRSGQYLRRGACDARAIWLVRNEEGVGIVLILHRLPAVSNPERLLGQSFRRKARFGNRSGMVVRVYLFDAARGGIVSLTYCCSD